MAALFSFEAHTPYRLFFSGKVEAITLALTDGEISVRAGHSFFTAPVASCILRITDETGAERAAFVADGILEVKNRKTVLMADAAEWPEEIDAARALAAKERAEAEAREALFRFERETAKAKLRRAEFRLKASELLAASAAARAAPVS